MVVKQTSQTRLSQMMTLMMTLAALVLGGCAQKEPLQAPSTPEDESLTRMAETLCSDTCEWAFDGECDDGGDGALFDACTLGSDCSDCGTRTGQVEQPSEPDRPSDPVDPSDPDPSDPSDPRDPDPDPDTCRPGCDGNVAISCEETRGIVATVRTTCGGRSECVRGECVTEELPSSVTIRADFGNVDPIYTESAGVLSIGGRPSLTEDLHSLPNLWDLDATVVSPSRGSCDPNLSFTLNSTQLAVVISGPTASCASFLDNVASRGLVATFDDVELQDGSGTLDVRVELDP